MVPSRVQTLESLIIAPTGKAKEELEVTNNEKNRVQLDETWRPQART